MSLLNSLTVYSSRATKRNKSHVGPIQDDQGGGVLNILVSPFPIHTASPASSCLVLFHPFHPPTPQHFSFSHFLSDTMHASAERVWPRAVRLTQHFFPPHSLPLCSLSLFPLSLSSPPFLFPAFDPYSHWISRPLFPPHNALCLLLSSPPPSFWSLFRYLPHSVRTVARRWAVLLKLDDVDVLGY